VTLHAGDGQQLGFTRQTDGSYLPDPGVRDTFDTSGKLTSMTERNGQDLSFSYTEGALTSITDSAGRLISLTYTGGLLTNVALPDLRNVSYAYTGGLLTSATDVRGNTVSYAYDSGGRLATITDQRNSTVVSNVYGTDGRVAQQTDGRGNTSTFAWDPTTETSTYTDARGNTWQDVYSGGKLVQRIDPLGGSTQYRYDLDLNLASVTDPDGNTTSSFYDSSANLLVTFDPLGSQTSYTYDSKNDLTSVIDPLGNRTSYDYDSAGNLTAMIRPGSIRTDYGRDPGGTGLLTSATDPNGNTTTCGYDSAGNLTSITDPLGNKTTMAYDPSGRIISRVDPRGNVAGADPNQYDWRFTYNKSDRLLTKKDPLANTTTFAYNKVQALTSVTDPNGNQITYTYDAVNNLTSVVAPDQATTSYTYDETNNLTGRTDPNNDTWTYAYDGANRLAAVTSPLSEIWSFAYDPAGNLRTKILPSSGTIDYTYDGANRLDSIDYSDATPDVYIDYDAVGNRTSITDGAGTASFTYDVLSRLTGITRGTDAFTYGYDAAGNLTSRTYPDSTQIVYGYDDANELTSVTTGGTSTTYGYDPARNLVSAMLPPNTSARSYDRAGRLTRVVNKRGNPVVSSFIYTLDPAGNPTQVVTKTETITYTYDSQNRLTQVCYLQDCSGSGLAGISYTYDGVGNRLTETRYGSSPVTTYYAYNPDDELCWRAGSTGTCSSPPTGATTYTYDPNGNQTAAGSRTFTYDLENRLVSTTAGGATESYTYDGDGNRLTLSQGGTAQTFYLWDSNASVSQLAIERDGSGSLLRRYVYGQVPLSVTTGGSARYFLPDGQGSIANVTSLTGTAQWTYTYEPFGTLRSEASGSGAATNVLKFDGELVDATTGLYDLRARMFDPTTGRFLQQDPVANPRTLPYTGSYVFVGDRPTVEGDPSGKCWLICVGAIVGGIVSGVSYSFRVWRDPAVAWSWKGLGVNVVSGVATGAVAGGALMITPEVGSTTAILLTTDASVLFNQLGASICGAGLVSGSDMMAMGFSLVGSVVQGLTRRLLPVSLPGQVSVGVGSGDVTGGYFNTIVGPSCGTGGGKP